MKKKMGGDYMDALSFSYHPEENDFDNIYAFGLDADSEKEETYSELSGNNQVDFDGGSFVDTMALFSGSNGNYATSLDGDGGDNRKRISRYSTRSLRSSSNAPKYVDLQKLDESDTSDSFFYNLGDDFDYLNTNHYRYSFKSNDNSIPELKHMDEHQLRDLIIKLARDPGLDTGIVNRIVKEHSAEINRTPIQLKESINWNGIFQDLLTLRDDEDKFSKLFHLAHDFVYSAKTYSKIIISESSLPDHVKTIKPVSVGGVAGGSKFIVQNILFKFILDVELRENFFMYGGDARSDQNAIKSASHELKGLLSYYSTGIKGLCFPLMAVIDYKGFRMVAMSILPIDQTTIKYGSSDAGRSVHCEIPEFNEKMKTASEFLNLKKHVVGTEKVLHSAGDIEGHLGKDSRYYLLDFARSFPPECPDPNPERKFPRQEYFQMLRPEFVRLWPKPLCPDAFTKWQKNDPEREDNNIEIYKATQHLYNSTIPRFVEKLESIMGNRQGRSFEENKMEFAKKFARIHSDKLDFSEDLKNVAVRKDVEILGNIRLIEEMHRVGINVRHLGRIRNLCRSAVVRSTVLLEMVARVVKDLMNTQMRKVMSKIGTLSEEPFNRIVVEFFSFITEENKDSLVFWDFLKKKIQLKFYLSLDDEERSIPGIRLKDSLDIPSLVDRISDLVGVKISDQALQSLHQFPDSFVLVDSDIEEVYAKVKHMNIIDFAEGMSLYLRSETTE
eukprot:TRINITY_DN5373_c0_g1_i1.p1 TRINITY_DN5373_c0_g1~~TRINITY_DN5373_c0_g1_i1.p1  ORF type:complete len:726 (-),score=148.54 TRINITY_DN5373_c0_g1_i1:468-2645(-)